MSEPHMNKRQLSPSEPGSLERGYRRLLRWYPRWFRLQNEDEILAVLLACAPDGQRRPSLEASLDLLKGAARMRLRPRPGQPRTVFAAIWLMTAGAAAGVAGLITLWATEGEIKATLIARYPALAHALARAVSTQVTIDEITGPVSLGVLLWLTWMSSGGNRPLPSPPRHAALT